MPLPPELLGLKECATTTLLMFGLGFCIFVFLIEYLLPGGFDLLTLYLSHL